MYVDSPNLPISLSAVPFCMTAQAPVLHTFFLVRGGLAHHSWYVVQGVV